MKIDISVFDTNYVSITTNKRQAKKMRNVSLLVKELYQVKPKLKKQSNQNRSKIKDKNFFQILQEMPFSKDKIGQSFVIQSKKR